MSTTPAVPATADRVVPVPGPGPVPAVGVNSPDNVQSVSGQHPAPHASDHPTLDGAAAENEQEGAPRRQSAFGIKEKLTNQKEKMRDATNPPGGFDTTPIPDAPPGYTIKFTFHRCTNLPVADYGKHSSDPFIKATLTTSLPKRHKEDPDLVMRTRTIHRSTEPAWEEDWIVANVPQSGFKLKCRLYDEDWPDRNDRLGNVSILVNTVNEHWVGFTNREFDVKKRMASKRAYILRAAHTAFAKGEHMTPVLYISAQVLGKSDPPHGQMYTVGPTKYFRHFSPMIGRLAGVQVNKNEGDDSHVDDDKTDAQSQQSDGKTQKYDFQANEVQFSGPVPPKLYHRYVEFRPVIGLMFQGSGVRGRVLHKALTHQHHRIYNFDPSTEFGTFPPRSEEASLTFLKLAHFDQGGRIFTYVLTLDGLFRFTETGKEFGIDLLSKHTMHSDVATYIACSGEFFIRRLKKPTASSDPEPNQPTHPGQDVPGGPPHHEPPAKPEYYQLIIDNDSGTYRPDKSVLPDLKKFLEGNLPGLGIVTLACDDEEDQKLKAEQREIKKREGHAVQVVQNRSPSSSDFSSDDVSDLEEMEETGGGKTKRERLLDMLEGQDKAHHIAKDEMKKPVQGLAGSSDH